MTIDVHGEIVIEASRRVVAGFAADPGNAPEWYTNIESVEWLTPPPVELGSRISFVAHFLGRRLAYTYEVVEFAPGTRMVMRTAEGPFPMETTYTWEPLSEGRSRMTVRNAGKPSGFTSVAAPVLASAMRHAVTKDLQQLKRIMEERDND